MPRSGHSSAHVMESRWKVDARGGRRAQEEQVKALLAAGGAELTSMVDAEGRAALQLAAAGGHCAVMRALLAGGAEPGMQDTSGNSALHAAAEGGSRCAAAGAAACDPCAEAGSRCG